MSAHVIRVGVDELPRVLERGEQRFEKALLRGSRRGAERARAIMVKRTPTDQGQLRASWKVVIRDGAAELINDAPHAGIVEMGARPHKVSAEGWAAIYEWVRRHPQLYSGNGRDEQGRFTGRRRGNSPTVAQLATQGPFRGLDPEISGITWAIVRKLNREGQKPTFFVLRSLDECRGVLVIEIERAIARAMAQGAGSTGGAA